VDIYRETLIDVLKGTPFEIGIKKIMTAMNDPKRYIMGTQDWSKPNLCFLDIWFAE
jgi:hypothetical protein